MEIQWKQEDGDWIAYHRDIRIARVHATAGGGESRLELHLLAWTAPGYWPPGKPTYLAEVEDTLKKMLNAVIG